MSRRRKPSAMSSFEMIIDKNKKSRIGRMACTLCEHYVMGSSIYVIMLGLIGTVITAFDIIRIMNSNKAARSSSRSRDGESDVERDLKLMTSILGIEHYTLIMLGAITEYPMLHTPWLLMQLCVMIVEIIVFLVRLFLDGLHMKSDEILLAILTVHNWLQVGELYGSVTCFATNCLSSIALEAGARSPLGSSMTKSVAFNTLFRRSYNLKIKILVTSVITGLITTITMTLGNKYGVPYLYLPWLLSTINGMALCEGPALFGLARLLLPNATFPILSFLLMSLLLYVEELCIWNDVFTSFRDCWAGYHRRKKSAAQRADEEPIGPRYEILPCREQTEKDANVAAERFADGKKLIDLCDEFNSEVTGNPSLEITEDTTEDESNFVRNPFVDVTG